MRIIYILILLFDFTFSGVYGQEKVEFIGPENDVLYYGIPNLIKIVIDGKILTPDKYDVEIRRWNWQTEVAGPTTYDKTDSGLLIHAMVFANEITIKDKRGKIIATKSFKRRNIPEPVISLDGGPRGGDVSKYYLLNRRGLIPLLTDNIFSSDIRVDIKSYYAVITIANETFRLKCKGCLLSDTLKSYIKRMRPFDKLELNNFELTPPFGKINNPVTFEIREGEIELDYDELISDYEERVEKPANAKDLHFHDNDFASVIKESDCEMQSDNCSLKRIYKYSTGESVTVKYVFQGLDSMQVEVFSEGILLANLNYYLGKLCGPATIYNLNGHKLIDGNYMVDTNARDTITTVNQLTLNNEQVTEPAPRSYKNGEWLYYKNEMVVKRLNCRKGIEMISPKQ